MTLRWRRRCVPCGTVGAIYHHGRGLLSSPITMSKPSSIFPLPPCGNSRGSRPPPPPLTPSHPLSPSFSLKVSLFPAGIATTTPYGSFSQTKTLSSPPSPLFFSLSPVTALLFFARRVSPRRYTTIKFSLLTCKKYRDKRLPPGEDRQQQGVWEVAAVGRREKRERESERERLVRRSGVGLGWVSPLGSDSQVCLRRAGGEIHK